LDKKGGSGMGDGSLDWTGNDFDHNGIRDDDKNVNVDLNGDGICISLGINGKLDTVPSGDDIKAENIIWDGSNRQCETVATGDDYQVHMVGWIEQPNLLKGYDDWANLHFRSVISGSGTGNPVPPHAEITYEESLVNEEFLTKLFNSDLSVKLTVDKPDANPGDILTYTVTVKNNGGMPATSIILSDINPDNTIMTVNLNDLEGGESVIRTFSYFIPLSSPYGAHLINRISVTDVGRNGNPDYDLTNNEAQVTTTIADNIPPITSITMDGTLGSNNWFISDVTFTFTSSDNPSGSGVASTEYSLDGTTWTTYTAPFTITAEGTTTVFYHSTDNAGNVEEIKQQAINIQKTPPTPEPEPVPEFPSAIIPLISLIGFIGVVTFIKNIK
jgi:uncharacterized repeat protein (TIGR01451 family)